MSKINDYLVLVEGGPSSNYGAWSPDVLGCVALGDTIDETVRELRTALVSHFELMRHHGEPIPEPTGPGVYFEWAMS